MYNIYYSCIQKCSAGIQLVLKKRCKMYACFGSGSNFLEYQQRFLHMAEASIQQLNFLCITLQLLTLRLIIYHVICFMLSSIQNQYCHKIVQNQMDMVSLAHSVLPQSCKQLAAKFNDIETIARIEASTCCTVNSDCC